MTEQYLAYLKTDAWRNKAKAVIKRDGKCLVCKSKKKLTAHHLTYTNIFKENLDELLTLCWPCHKKLHKIANKNKCSLSDAMYTLKTGIATRKEKILHTTKLRKTVSANARSDYKEFRKRQDIFNEIWKKHHPVVVKKPAKKPTKKTKHFKLKEHSQEIYTWFKTPDLSMQMFELQTNAGTRNARLKDLESNR